MRNALLAWLAASWLTLVGVGLAHVRLIHISNGQPLYWSNPANITVVINASGSSDIFDQSHVPALRAAIADWNAVQGSSARLIENDDPAQMARTNWSANDIHLLFFDETNSSGYFPPGSGVVAITPVWFQSNGRITDADVLFNGKGYQFTTSAAFGKFDVGDVGAHELGHLLGFDHSGFVGASLYPYVDPSVSLHRSPSADDHNGLRSTYPEETLGSIEGTILRAWDETAVAGAHVVARDADGRPVSAALSDEAGHFVLGGLDAGSYRVYARPLDEPVSESNLGSGWSVETDFAPALYASPISVASGAMVQAGELFAGADATINLGRVSDSFPKRAQRGTSTSLLLHGSGLMDGSSLVASDPEISVSNVSWLGSSVQFTLAIPADEQCGHFDLTATTPFGASSILTGGIEITAASPSVSQVAPTAGSTSGGTFLSVLGANFRNGARVVLGGALYIDGAIGQGTPGYCRVLDSQHLELLSLPTLPGVHDLVVIDECGVEGRLAQAYQAALVPSIAKVFPAAGQAAGGTLVTLTGQDFAAGLVLRFDGQELPECELISPTQLRLETPGGLAGGPYLIEVENPDGSVASATFAYALEPDPALLAVSPGAGPAVGGQTLTLLGANFSSNAQVFFGVDASTGAGGVEAQNMVHVDSGTLAVVTPALSGGTVNVMVCDPDGQASVLEAAFQYESSAGGAGGACSLAHPGQGANPDGLWWLCALGLWVLWRARCAAARVPQRG